MIGRFLLGSIIVYFIVDFFWKILSRKSKDNDSTTHFKEKNVGGIRIIEIRDMTEVQCIEYIDNFKDMVCGNDRDSDFEKPDVVTTNDSLLLTFSTSMDCFSFFLWVNYMTYCDEKHRFQVTGWYQTGEIIFDNEGDEISHTIIMVTIPKCDEEYDNVYFVTEKGQRFKCEFASSGKLYSADTARIVYRSIPIQK